MSIECTHGEYTTFDKGTICCGKVIHLFIHKDKQERKQKRQKWG
jgi:hypothetical protein